MRIAFNPSTVKALTTPPNNKDITFDLRGQNIFARGVKFCGTDTNTWRDIKINNVSIGSNTLDLRDGDNTTLTNINGVVTINSTWRPVVDNLTSDSTTSSLSANQGRILKSLIDGKSDLDHNHDDRYLRLTGGWMSGDIKFRGNNKIYWGRNTDAASISFKNDGDEDDDSYMSFVTSDNGNEYFRWSHISGSTNTEWMSLRSNGLRVGGTKVSLEGHSHNDLYYTKTEVNNKLNGKSDTSHTHDDRYLKLTGGTLTGDLYINTNLYGPAIGNNPRNRYDAALYFFNCNSSTTSTYNFGLYQWDNEFRFTYRTSTNNLWKGNSFTIQGSDGQVIFTKTPKVGSTSISLDGHTHAYLPLSGGTMSGTIYRNSGGTTISGRDHAIIRQTYAPGGSSWNPIACVDTETGTWTLGHLSQGSSNTDFNFCFSTNADYNAGNNNGNYVTLRNKIGTIALLSEIPDKNSWNYDDRYLKLTGGTMNGNARIGHGSGNLYIGNSGSDGWVAVQDICSQDSIGDGKWSIRVDGTASFQSIKFPSNRLIAQVSSGSNSPLKGIKLPYLEKSGIGIFSRVSNGGDEGGIVLSEDTCVIYNSFDTGWGLSVRDKDIHQTDISGDDTIAFGVRQDYRAYSLGGFEKSGSDNSYVLLGGGDHKLESSLNVAHANTSGQSWDVPIQGQHWSRLFAGIPNILHHSSIFSISGTIGCVLFCQTFLVESSHAGSATIICLFSGSYTQPKMRALAKSDGTVLVDLFWSGNDCSQSSSTQQMTINVIANVLQGSISPITSLTNDDTIPSGYSNTCEFQCASKTSNFYDISLHTLYANSITVNHEGSVGIYLYSSSGESSYSMQAKNGKRWVAGADTDRYFIGNDTVGYQFNITNSGNVGIGTTSPSSKLTVNGDTIIGSKSKYYQRSARGQVHHEFVCDDSDYGGVKITHNATEGSDGPGSYTASLFVQDNRPAHHSGVYQPTVYIQRAGATRTMDPFGIDVGPRIFTVGNDGKVTIGAQIASSVSSEQAIARIQITPYRHTGGPWYIKSKDDPHNSFLTVDYNATECLRIRDNGDVNVTKSLWINNSHFVKQSGTTYTSQGRTVYTLPTSSINTNTAILWTTASSGSDTGIFYNSSDFAFIANSNDHGAVFAVYDTDVTHDFEAGAREISVPGSGGALWARGGFSKSGSSNDYVLLGGGGHKALSDFASSSHSHNYAANENYGGFTKSGRLPISGFYQSTESESGGNAPWSNWMHLINCQYSNTNNNYALQIAASFYDNNTFKIRVTNDDVNNNWRDIIHSGNIGSQSVNYANSAGNAQTLGGISRNQGQKPFGKIPYIGNDGVMEIGKHIDFHYDNSGSYDFSTRLYTSGNNGNIVILPSESGTLALTDNLNNYYWAYDNKYIKQPICLEFITFVSYQLTNSIWSSPIFTNESGSTNLTIPNLTVPYSYDVYALVISHSNPNSYATIQSYTPLQIKIIHRESFSGHFAVMIWAIPS